MELSPQQAVAADRVRSWLEDPATRSREPGVFRLFGYAGAGKSSLARTLASGVQGPVFYAAFTGKAALVMRRKGCAGAQTVHSLIYVPKDRCRRRLRDLEEQLRSEGDPDRRRELQALVDRERENAHRPSFSLNEASPLRGAALLVLDEVSMIAEAMATDLLSFGAPILALGDPAQLPPVGGRGYFTDPRQEPDTLLTEIHRQAEGSPVLQLATLIRAGAPVQEGDWGTSRVAPRGGVSLEDALKSHEQIIVGRNATRRAVNARARGLLHGPAVGPHPVPGDRIVCRRNDHEVGILNGQQFEVLLAESVDSARVLLTIRGLEEDHASPFQVEAHTDYFEGRSPAPWDVREAQCFDYAYAITCHTSQGSQWPSVCVVDESRCFSPDERRWLYTAVTRAENRVTIIRQ